MQRHHYSMKRLNFKPKAVIFDMDGVVVDSMAYHFISWYEALRPYGVQVNCFDIYSREGERWEKSLKELLAKRKIKPTAKLLKRIFRERNRIFRTYFKRFIFQGVDEALACLSHKGYRLGLVSGTPTLQIQRILPKKILTQFNCVIGGDQVKNGKPHPEPYLNAAKELEVLPSECVVIENAPLGIASAKRAGMFCLALTTSLPKEYLREADIVLDEIGAVVAVIGCRV